MDIKLTPSRTVGDFKRCYVIAELGANHNGDMDLARRLIRAAKEAGADCVKFQSWTKDSVFSKIVYEENRFLSDDYRNRSDTSLKDIVDRYHLSEQQLAEMKAYADSLQIDFASTPFSNAEVDFLVDELRSPFVKVASMDLNNYPFLEYIAKKNVPVVLSTGLSTLSEIDKAVRTIEGTGNSQIVILHCVSIYPPDDAQVNLNNMDTLRTLYPYPVGFSDHTLGALVAIAATAKGACVIEKHFTLDKTLPGWDHKVSATPEELAVICEAARRIPVALGSRRIEQVESEERLNAFRRSIVAARDIKAGEIVDAGALDFKRPGNGLRPEYAELLVGRKAKRDIAYDQMISLEDF